MTAIIVNCSSCFLKNIQFVEKLYKQADSHLKHIGEYELPLQPIEYKL